MATVDSVVTPTTVRMVLRSLVSFFGITADSASAAEAPQIATAPPVSRPRSRCRPSARASSPPAQITSPTAASTVSTGPSPRSPTCSSVMRAPSSATPRRSTVRAANSIPGRQRPSSLRKCSDMPNSKA